LVLHVLELIQFLPGSLDSVLIAAWERDGLHMIQVLTDSDEKMRAPILASKRFIALTMI
jgi:hypothetical protein